MDVCRGGTRGPEFQFTRVEVTCRYARPRGYPRPGISIRTCGSDVQVRNTSGGAAGSEFDVQPRVRHVRALNWKMYVLVTCM